MKLGKRVVVSWRTLPHWLRRSRPYFLRGVRMGRKDDVRAASGVVELLCLVGFCSNEGPDGIIHSWDEIHMYACELGSR